MTIHVYVSLDGADVLAGRLYPHRRRGSESATFRYDDGYLSHRDSYSLDPQLALTSAAIQTDIGVKIFRAFADGAPDRWGRNLLLRRERLRAMEEGRAPRSFGEADFLLGVRDDLRQGALRYRTDDSPEFLAPAATGVPVLTDLPGLLRAADRAGKDEADREDLALLVRAGSSLGGARPKAHVVDSAGNLSIAKFPSPASDQWNVMAWEKTALDLARTAGINVSDSHLVSVDGRSVLIVNRFDRKDGRRVGYASALTMTEANDGAQASYLDIAEIIEERSRAATEHLHQLWRRIAFTVLISNTDDHLRNHGFLHQSGESWQLSPAFDLNPDPAPGAHSFATSIDEGGAAGDISALMAVAPQFRLSPESALGILGEVVKATGGWRATASANGLRASETSFMQGAFEHEPARQARLLV